MGTNLVPHSAHYRRPLPPVQAAATGGLRRTVQPPGSNHVAIVPAAMCTSLPVTLRRSTLDPVRLVGYETETNQRGERYVWLPPNVVDRLRAQRRPGEMRLASESRCECAPWPVYALWSSRPLCRIPDLK